MRKYIRQWWGNYKLERHIQSNLKRMSQSQPRDELGRFRRIA